MSNERKIMDIEPDWKDVVETYVSWLTGESTLVVGDKDEAFNLMIEHFRVLGDVASDIRAVHKANGDNSLMPNTKLFGMGWAATDSLSC